MQKLGWICEREKRAEWALVPERLLKTGVWGI